MLTMVAYVDVRVEIVWVFRKHSLHRISLLKMQMKGFGDVALYRTVTGSNSHRFTWTEVGCNRLPSIVYLHFFVIYYPMWVEDKFYIFTLIPTERNILVMGIRRMITSVRRMQR